VCLPGRIRTDTQVHPYSDEHTGSSLQKSIDFMVNRYRIDLFTGIAGGWVEVACHFTGKSIGTVSIRYWLKANIVGWRIVRVSPRASASERDGL
jgi:hypothetical protein